MNKLLHKSQSTTSDISVVICAYTEKRWDDLVLAVASLQQQTHQPKEIIVVIDHNPHLFQKACTTFADVILLENSEARGLSGARNCGIAIAKGAIVAFLDDDAVAAPDWLRHLALAYSKPEIVGIGGAIDPHWATERPAWFPHEFDWVVGCTYRGMPWQPAPVRNLIGANMSFRREVFERIGGFRTGMGRVGTRPVGCEETELCIRIYQQWPEAILRYEPQASVFHHVPSQRATWRYFRARCYAEGLSKAQVTLLVGANQGLATERNYTLRTLPLGVLAGLFDFMTHLDPTGLARAGAIILGFALTAGGYLVGQLGEQLTTWRRAVERNLTPVGPREEAAL